MEACWAISITDFEELLDLDTFLSISKFWKPSLSNFCGYY